TTAGGSPFFHRLTTNFTTRVAIRPRRLGFSDGLICSSRKEVRLSVMLPSRDRVLLFSRFPGYGLERNTGTESPPKLGCAKPRSPSSYGTSSTLSSGRDVGLSVSKTA